MNRDGFTLAELLIALAILGVIATFTIPKVLSSQQDTKMKATAKEAAATISAAYEAYRLNNTVTASTGPAQLTPYMNYVRVMTSGSIDDTQGTGGLAPCDSTNYCLLLHNGGALKIDNVTFGGTAPNDDIYFDFDPDASSNSTSATGPYKAVAFWLQYNGRVTTDGVLFNDPSKDPPWFNWN